MNKTDPTLVDEVLAHMNKSENVVPLHKAPLRLLRLSTVRERTGLKDTAIYALEAAGKFPKRVQIGPRAIGWVEHEIEQFIAERIAERDAKH